jgi:hypothetical protein
MAVIIAVTVIVLAFSGPPLPVWLVAAAIAALFVPSVWFPGPWRLESQTPAAEAQRTARSRALGMSNRVRLGVLLMAIAVPIWLIPTSPVKAPTLFILVGLPLVFELVPKNWLYGLRTPRTLSSSDDVWYTQNRYAGIIMVAIGVIWGLRLALR